MLILGLIGLLFIAGIGAFFAFAVARMNAAYAEFMDGCEHDHKHYECMLLWRATERDDPTTVPIPIPTPMQR